MKKWLPYVGAVVIAITCLVWLLRLEATASDAKESAKQNQEILNRLSMLQVESTTQLRMMLEWWKINPDSSVKWLQLPRTPPRNDSGQVLMNRPWITVRENLKLGIQYMVTGVTYDTVGVNEEGVPIVKQQAVVGCDTLWDTR